MAFFNIALAAAAQAASSQHVDPEAARAAGMAQAQAALSGTANTPMTNPTAVSALPPAAGVPSNVVNAVGTIAGQQPLNLTCAGAGVADKQRMGFAIGAWGAWASAVSHHDREFADQIDVRLFGGDDRIRIPRTMLPALHGGQDGWFKLKDVEADARSIRAHAAVAAFHNPKVYIDRVTGTISGKSGDYSGQCQAMDANAVAKF